jgi:hypothetical protein
MKKSIVNGESEMFCVRVKHYHVEQLRKKAKNNEKNPHLYVSKEINNLIDEDYEKAKKRASR